MSKSSSFFLKLHFFIRIKKFLHYKASSKSDKPSENMIIPIKEVMQSDSEEGLIVLQKSVKKLHFGSCEDKEIAAKDVMRLASKDLKTRKLLADLGVIPSLVSMMDSECSERRKLAVDALIALANGTYTQVYCLS
ncbi:hypothetical protein ACHQM5_005358 [Ranunculus cassubicifolius]